MGSRWYVAVLIFVAVLVATMDGDFTLVDRAIEERFGFSVAKNNRSLKPWLKRQSN